MKNILFVSIAFPPKSDAEGLQVAKYLKYLLRESEGTFNIDAVTSRHPTLNMSYDPSLESMAKGVRQTIELPIYENRYTNFLLRKLAPSLINRPESKFTFHWQAGKVIKKLKEVPDLIYSRSFPASSAVMAYKLKKIYNVPWVMHLSDIWADCPETKHDNKSANYNQEIEKICFQAADIICVTSKKTQSFYRKKYAFLNKRIELYPNVFDMDDIAQQHNHQQTNHKDKLKIVHTGSITGSRSAEAFLKALIALPPERQQELEVIFIGPIDSINSRIIENNPCECITYHGAVNYQKALEWQRAADILLLIDMPVEQPELRVYFPSKILDYMITNRPILALVDDDSEVQSVINTHNLGTCINRHDIKGIQDHILWLLSNRNSSYFTERMISLEYDAAYNAKRLIERFKEFV